MLDGRPRRKTSSHLSVCSRRTQREHSQAFTSDPRLAKPLAADMRKFLEYEMPRSLLDLFHVIRKDGPVAEQFSGTLTALGRVSKRGLAAHLSQHTEVALLNELGDARITFRFEVANLGLVPYAERVHQFWFDRPQTEVEFSCTDQYDSKIAVDVRAATPNFREVVLNLHRPLRPLETLRYEITFKVTGEFFGAEFYSLCPRTITDLLGFSVLGIPGYSLRNSCVTHESTDGIPKDNPPPFIVSSEGRGERLSWEARFPRPGEFFRTFWSCLPKTDFRETVPGHTPFGAGRPDGGTVSLNCRIAPVPNR
jgi:hypothetical protein